MSILSLSSTHESRPLRAGDPGRLALPAAQRTGRAPDDRDERVQASPAAPGLARNPLVSAMLQAVKGLAGPATTATPSSDAVAASDAATQAGKAASANQASALKDAAAAFAHELFGAISEFGSRAVAHHDHGRHRGHAYGHLAQRLDTLAAKLEAGATTSATTQTTVQTEATATTASTSTRATPDATETPVSRPADANATLVAAFEQFVRALNPSAAKAADAADGSTASASQKLASFLRSIAQSLRAGPAAAQSAVPVAGSLVNLSV